MLSFICAFRNLWMNFFQRLKTLSGLSVSSVNRSMENFQLETKLFNSLKKILDESQLAIYLELLKNYPKTEFLTWEIYPTFLSILMLEEMGNEFPSQTDIDAIELVLKRCNRICKNYILKLSTP